jgi:hypothetical protein
MKSPRTTNIFDYIISAFALGFPYGYGYRDNVRDLKAHRAGRNR